VDTQAPSALKTQSAGFYIIFQQGTICVAFRRTHHVPAGPSQRPAQHRLAAGLNELRWACRESLREAVLNTDKDDRCKRPGAVRTKRYKFILSFRVFIFSGSPCVRFPRRFH
jgi:hypothetical protein